MVEREGLGESDLICSLPLGNTVENGIQCLVFIQEYDRRKFVDIIYLYVYFEFTNCMSVLLHLVE